jgi:hypothetical protein
MSTAEVQMDEQSTVPTAPPKAMGFPAYLSHKVVWALPIAEIEETRLTVAHPDPMTPWVSFDDPRFFAGDRKPQVGDMLVIYEDGYVSWSPKDAFEAGYTRI